jgi:ketosteroid isomerase-like protein
VNSTVASVSSEFFSAFHKGDMAAARRLLRDDLTFKGPLDTFNNADDYVKAIGALAPIIKGIEFRRVLVDGDDVATFYDMLTPMGTAPIAEWHHIQDGKISAIQAYFDARPFAHAEANG